MCAIFHPVSKNAVIRALFFTDLSCLISKLRLLFLALLVLVSIDFIAAKASFAEVSNRIEFGAGLHLGQGKTYGNSALPSLRLMGFSSFRDEVYWGRLEDQSGQFGMARVPLGLKEALNSDNFGSSAMVILSYGNEKYDGGGRPVSDTGREAFKRYALAVSRMNPRVRYLEIWNEWNHAIGVRDGSKGTAEDYVRLVATVAPALRAAGTKSKIVVGALADDYPDWTFARELVSRGVLKYADAFSVHLYNYSAGDKAVPQEMLDRLERLQEILRAGNGGKDFPVLVTEFGWPTHIGKGGTPESPAGAYIAQLMLESTAYPWLRGLWLYELFDSGTTKSEREHNFGILDENGKPKEGACMVRAAMKLLEDANFTARGVTSNGVRWIQFNKAQGTLMIIYSPGRGKERDISLRRGLSKSAIPLCSAFGELVAADALSGWEIRSIGSEPHIIYFRDQIKSPNELLR